MDTEGDSVSLHIENEKLRHENEDLKVMLSLVKENHDLRSKVQHSTLTNNTLKESTGRKTTLQWQDTLEEGRFRDDLHKTVFQTSSPIDLESLTKNSIPTEPRGHKALPQCSHSYRSLRAKDQERLVGEVAFQLDRRILSYIFQGQARLYGFTVLNIQDKIHQISTHPLTGKVDESYKLQLHQRHAELMDKLNQLGYSSSLHPPFTEFIINTYGILKQRPDYFSLQEKGYNNPDFLRRMIINTAPGKLVKDLLILLSCLCFMARHDGRSLVLW